MTSPVQIGKTYGALHTENFFSFLGFAKKVGSDETQKIDVFLDNKLIDTIEANEFIQKIDDMYDVENKAFTYNLPVQYIGKKAIISFKNHESGEELLNSPYTLIDKNHEKFNEASFFHKLYFEFDNKKIQNINPKDSIGFLATEDNILNKDLIKLINTFLEQNLDTRFKLFYFNNEQKKLISEKFNKYLSKFDFIIPKDIYDIANNTSIYIHSSTANEKPKSFGYHKTWQVLNQTKANLFKINLFTKIEDVDKYSSSLKLIDDSKMEFEKSVVSEIFKNDERYNELCFMNSLNIPIEEKIKNTFKSNTIGFFASEENLKNQEFINYIKKLIIRFPNLKIKGFYFYENQENIIKEKFNEYINKLELFIPLSMNDIVAETSLYIFNYGNTNKLDIQIFKEISNNFIDTPCTTYFNILKNKDYEEQVQIMNKLCQIFKDNFNYFGLDKKYINNTHKMMYKKILPDFISSYNYDLFEFENFIKVELFLYNNDFTKKMYEFNKKLHEL